MSITLTLAVASLLVAQEASTDVPDEFQRWMEETFTEPQGDPETEETPAAERPPAASIPAYSSAQVQLLQITQRRNGRLAAHPALMASAQRLADYHARTGRWGHSNRTWRGNASENIAWNGSRSVSQLGTQWTNSRSHNGNWLSNWKYVGVGVAYTGGRVYGVQHFSNSPTGAQASSPSLQGRRTTSTRRYTTSRRRGLFSRWRRGG